MCSCLFTCDEIQNVCQLGQAQCLGFTIIMSHWAKCTTLLSIEYMSKITLFRAKFSTKVTPLPRRKNKIPPCVTPRHLTEKKEHFMAFISENCFLGKLPKIGQIPFVVNPGSIIKICENCLFLTLTA